MPNRIIYQVENLFAGPAPATGAHQAFADGMGGTYGSEVSGILVYPLVKPMVRIQSANYGYSLNRRDVNQFGELAAIDRVSLEPPTVNLDFTYLVNSMYNEKVIGFFVNDVGTTTGQALTALRDMLNKTQDERNYWIQTNAEGVDANEYGVSAAQWSGFGSGITYIGLGNAFVSNYSVEAAVGDFPRATVSLEAMNITFSAGSALVYGSGPYGVQLVSGKNVSTTTAGQNTGTWQYNKETRAGYRLSSGTAAVVDVPAVNPVDGVPVTGPLYGLALIPPARSHPGTGRAAAGFSDARLSVLRPGDITVDVVTAGTNTALDEIGAKVVDAKIQSFNLSVAMNREPLNKLGTKFSFARELSFPITVTMRLDGNVGDAAFANLANVIDRNSLYDCYVKMKSPSGWLQAVYAIRGATLDSQSFTSSIGPNKAVSYTWNAQVGGPTQTTVGLFFSGVTEPRYGYSGWATPVGGTANFFDSAFPFRII